VTRPRLAVIALAAACLITMPGAGHAAPPAAEQEDLPVPPVPPEHPPDDVAAPVPNADLTAPVPQASAGPSLRPTLNERPPDLPGGDPIPGTVYRYDQEQKRQFIPNPGIQLVVPLQK
jgi:hypothetical protein